MIKFVFYLFQNYKNHREVSFYADALNFSPNHFTRIIKKASGRTPSQWIALVTINQAKNYYVKIIQLSKTYRAN